MPCGLDLEEASSTPGSLLSRASVFPFLFFHLSFLTFFFIPKPIHPTAVPCEGNKTHDRLRAIQSPWDSLGRRALGHSENSPIKAPFGSYKA